MIKQFKDEYSWLSNFYLCLIKINSLIFPSVEHAYQSEKSQELSWKILCQNEDASIVKKKSRKLEINLKEWNKRKLKVMEECINQKFDQEPFKSLLLQTGEKYIQEGNYWGDEYWGVNLKTGKGLNHLGKLIMKKRDKLNNKLF